MHALLVCCDLDIFKDYCFSLSVSLSCSFLYCFQGTICFRASLFAEVFTPDKRRRVLYIHPNPFSAHHPPFWRLLQPWLALEKCFISVCFLFFFWLTGSSQKHSAAHWCLQNIAQESIDSSDEEFFDARGWCCSCLLCFLHPFLSIPTGNILESLISI